MAGLLALASFAALFKTKTDPALNSGAQIRNHQYKSKSVEVLTKAK
jgi:hypothetical protein